MLKKILKFCITGGLGTVTNLALFYIFADCLHFHPNAVSAGCFLISCSQNYIINHVWTFRMENDGIELSFRLWAKFVAASLVGFTVNQTVLFALTRNFNWHFVFLGTGRSFMVVPQAIGILCGMVLNFIFSNFIVFGRKPENATEINQ